MPEEAKPQETETVVIVQQGATPPPAQVTVVISVTEGRAETVEEAARRAITKFDQALRNLAK